jgi:hypothetical protein
VNLAIRRSLYDVSLAQLAGTDPRAVEFDALEQELKPRAGGRAAAAISRA